MRIFAISLLSLALAGCATVAAPQGSQCFHRNVEFEREFNYCQAVRHGDTLYVSGTVGAGEMGTAVDQAYKQVGQTLAARGLTFQDVVKEVVYTTDIEALKNAKDRRRAYYKDHKPAATWIQVSRLFDPQYVVEVEVEAKFR